MYALHGEKAIVAWSLVGQVIAVVSTICCPQYFYQPWIGTWLEGL